MTDVTIGQAISALGPIGVLIVICVFLYIRFGGLSSLHDQNVTKLDDILRTVKESFEALTVMNGKVVKLEERLSAHLEHDEEWQRLHDKQDDERYQRNQDDHETIRRAGDITRTSLHELRNEITKDAARAYLNRRDS